MNSRAKYAVVMSSTLLVGLLLVGGVVTKGAATDGQNQAGAQVYRHLAVYSRFSLASRASTWKSRI
jgi:hypothetical protein